MIAVDTSALMAIVLDEPAAEACAAVLAAEDRLLISAGTVAEALIVAGRRGVGDEVEQLLEGLGLEIVSVTPPMARLVAQTCAQWGQGVHPAGLNFGDCFAYALAQAQACRLLYVGDDFARTDVGSALRDG